MNTKKIDNLKSLLILLLLISGIRSIPYLPWWSFTIAVAITGTMINYRAWKTSFFGIGFLAGFILWAGANFYFDMTQAGDILTSVGKLLFVPKIVVIAISGIIGGLLTGLSFYTGKNVITTETTTMLETNSK